MSEVLICRSLTIFGRRVAITVRSSEPTKTASSAANSIHRARPGGTCPNSSSAGSESGLAADTPPITRPALSADCRRVNLDILVLPREVERPPRGWRPRDDRRGLLRKDEAHHVRVLPLD